MRALDGAAAYWDENAELLASLLDAVERQTFYLLKVNGNDPPVPEPLRRPGKFRAEPKTVTLADWASTL